MGPLTAESWKDLGAMDDDLLQKLEQRLNRRAFLRGSSLFAAALAVPAIAAAQAPSQPPKDEGDRKDTPAPDAPSKDADQDDPYKQTKLDEQGRPFRMCPQCGSNMYRQEKTWTCESCGYSYVE